MFVPNNTDIKWQCPRNKVHNKNFIFQKETIINTCQKDAISASYIRL